MINRFYIVFLCVIAVFALILYLLGCRSTVQESVSDGDKANLSIYNHTSFTELTLKPKANYRTPTDHVDAVVSSIQACDEGIAHCNYIIEHCRVFSLLTKAHKARAEYLSVRAALLFQLWTVCPVGAYDGVLK